MRQKIANFGQKKATARTKDTKTTWNCAAKKRVSFVEPVYTSKEKKITDYGLLLTVKIADYENLFELYLDSVMRCLQ